MDVDEALTLLKAGPEGIAEWNQRRDSGEDFPDLGWTNLCDANLCGADLSRADLVGADLSRANLFEANLTKATLWAADLRWANLSQVDLSEADLPSANLSEAKLRGADLHRAICASTTFADVDLSEVKGLNSVHHQGPSTIGVNTIVNSNGKIPEAFLRGCGVPDAWIEYLPSLFGSMQPLQFYSCFISHSSWDQAFADRLHSRMVQEKLGVWYSPVDMPWGEKLHEKIDEAIRVHDKLLLVLSTHSLASEWVKTEIRKARKAENKDGKRRLFPIRLVDFETIRDWECFDADIGKDLGVEIREYIIPDFSNWKDQDAFEAAFNRLLKSLKAKESLSADAASTPATSPETPR